MLELEFDSFALISVERKKLGFQYATLLNLHNLSQRQRVIESVSLYKEI